MSFSIYMKQLREKNGITQQALADELGVNISTIKRIEARKSKTPNSRLLNSLANYTGDSIVKIMEDLFFPNTKQKGVHADAWDFGFKFLSYMYINGWNFSPMATKMYPATCKFLHRPDSYIGLLTKKRQTTKCYVKLMSNYPLAYESEDPDVTKDFIFEQLILASKFEDLKKVNNYIFLFNVNAEKELKFYKKFKAFHLDGIKLNIKGVLYDAVENKIVDQYQITGNDFSL